MAENIHEYDAELYSGLISEVLLPGMTKPYQIHDPEAIHSVEDLGLSKAIVFKGVVDTYEELPKADQKIGDVWYIKDNDREVIWVGTEITTDGWEEFGSGISLGHTHTVTASGSASLSGQNSMTGSATVTGGNTESDVTGSVDVPTVESVPVYVKATSSAPVLTPSTAKVLTGFGAHSTASAITDLETTTIKNPTATDVSIPNVTGNANVTASKVEVTAAAASKITGNEEITASHITNNANVTASKVETESVSIPNVTESKSVTASKISENTSVTASKVSASDVVAHKVVQGSAASWSATVTDGGCLVFGWTANVPSSGEEVTCSKVTAEDVVASKITASDVSASQVTLGAAIEASKVSASDVIASKVTASEVKASKVTAVDVDASHVTAEDVSASKVTLGTAIEASKVTTATVTVATGAKSTANAITGLGTLQTEDVITNVSAAAPVITLAKGSESDFHTGDDITVGSASADIKNGKAAAQTWTQNTGTASVSGNIAVSGNVSVSGTTGDPVNN